MGTRWSSLVVLTSMAFIGLACNAGQAGRPDIATTGQTGAAQATAEQSAVDRGKYLVTIAACNDCHTPFKMGERGPEPDMSRMLSGHPQDLKMPPPPNVQAPWMYAGATTNTAFAGPWGLTYAINLTPDKETGIGLWSEQVFVNALKTGRHMGVGRPILPPMPWQYLGQATDEDLRAIFAYLRTIEAKKNQVPDSVIRETPPPAAPTPPTAPAAPAPPRPSGE